MSSPLSHGVAAGGVSRLGTPVSTPKTEPNQIASMEDCSDNVSKVEEDEDQAWNVPQLVLDVVSALQDREELSLC
jgi:hypothetical protein